MLNKVERQQGNFSNNPKLTEVVENEPKDKMEVLEEDNMGGSQEDGEIIPAAVYEPSKDQTISTND